MTTPHQSLPATLETMLGIGAFQIGGGPQNYGQNIAEDFVRGLINGPAVVLGQAFTSLENFLEQLGTWLSSFSLDALKTLQSFIPGSVLADFANIPTAVTTIINALSLDNLKMTLHNFEQWLESAFNVLLTEVHQILDAIQGFIITPITDRVSGFVDWLAALTGFQTTTGVDIGNLQTGLTGAVDDLQDLINTIVQKITGDLGSVGNTVSNVGSELASFLSNLASQTANLNASGLFDASALTNISNIPAIAQANITGLVTQIQHLGSTGIYDAAQGFQNLSTSLLKYINSSTGQFNAAQLSNIANIPAIAQESITGLVSQIQHLGATGIYDASQGFQNLASSILKFIDSGTGQFDASQLFNMANIPAIAQSSITGLLSWQSTTTTNITNAVTDLGNLVDQIVQKLTGGSSVGNAVSQAGTEIVNFLNNLAQGVTGAVNSGISSTGAAVQGALAGLSESVASAQSQIADLLGRMQPQSPATVVGGNAPTTVASGTWGAGWTLSGTAASTACVTAKGYWNTDSGSSARTLVGINTTATSTDYQSIRFLLTTMMETPLAGGSGNAGNSLVFRADSTSSPANYGELRFYYNEIKLFGWSSGSSTLLNTWSVTPQWGATYSLDCGTANGLNKYQLYCNGLAVGSEVTDAGNVIHTGSGYRYGGMKMYTDARGAGESSPGVVGYWKVSDNPPTQKVGSGFKVCRINTATVSFTNGTAAIPNNFYDTVDRITNDFSWSASTSTMTVRDAGWYSFSISLPFLATNGTFNTSGNAWAVAVSVDGVLDSFASTTSTTDTGIYATFPPVYCQSGSQVSPVYSTNTTKAIAGGYGTQTAFERTIQWFAGAKLGQVVV